MAPVKPPELKEKTMEEKVEGYRCFNDLFAYCSGKPRGSVKRVKPIGTQEYDIPCCTQNITTCGKYRTASQVLVGNHPEKKETDDRTKS
jgi:hypothetical protein